jgi:ABC-type multidrug transport system ATPase subunit
LKQATGYLLPGQTHYIMGPSGAGKTTLLNAISGRLRIDKKHVLEGTRELNDCIKLNQHSFGKYGAYVMQDDVLYEYFTVKEALMFAAKLKLNTTDELRHHRVMQLIVELGLIKCMNTQIGSILRKTISGGEKKRTAIGVELITDPSLVILDEPTSGLDSFMAVSIIQTLHRLSRNRGKTILATIH